MFDEMRSPLITHLTSLSPIQTSISISVSISMMLFCSCLDKSRNVSIDRQETEKPRLVRVHTPSGDQPVDKRVSLPQRVHSQLSMRESFSYKRDSGRTPIYRAT